jgi:hypothetical protein
MSKFTRVRTKITSDIMFCRALGALGIPYKKFPDKSLTVLRIVGGTSFTTQWGQSAQIARYADISLEYDPNTDSYSLRYAGDYGERNDVAIQLILQQYALMVVQQAIADRGMEIVEMERQPDGAIRARVVAPSSFGSAQQPAVETRIHIDGTVEANLSGFAGQACAPVVQHIQQQLGGDVLSDEPGPDWWGGDDGAALWRNDYDQAG